MHGMEKTINCIELSGIHLVYKMMQDFNRSSSHMDMVTIRAVSAGDQSSNPSSGGWEMGYLSCPSKGESYVTSWGGGQLGHGGVFVFFSDVAGRKKGEEEKKVGPKNLQCVLDVEHIIIYGRPSLG